MRAGLVVFLLAAGAAFAQDGGTVVRQPHAGGAASAQDGGTFVRQTREIMFTRVTVAIADPLPEADRKAAFDAAFSVFADVDEQMNEWKPDSPLGKLNAAGKGTAPGKLCEVIEAALKGAYVTGGLFDPSWAALKDIWKFGPDGGGKLPTKQQVKTACARVSFKDVQLEPIDTPSGYAGGCKVRLGKKGMKLGLGGIAKGWGVDQAVRALRARGLSNFFVQAGGDLYLAGKNGDRPWRAAIRDPRGPMEKTFAQLEVSDAAFSTSGDYEHFFFVEGVRYHHIIDPRDCWPAKASRSATVLAKSAVEAEYLTKAVFIAGGSAGLELAEKVGASAVIVDKDNAVHVSKSLDGRLVHWAPTP